MTWVMRVLVAEDEKALADLVAEGLRRYAMAVDIAYDGTAAAERLSVNDYDVLVLDRDLPGRHGDAICRDLAQAGARTRILMLTAAASVRDRVAGLGLGADDYLPKPFDYAELVARVQALGRRSQTPVPPLLTHRDIVLDTPRMQAFRDGRYLALSRKEFAVLEVLMRADGAIVSAEELLERAWDEHTDPFSGVVRVTMSKLRAKLGDPPVIETVAGSGYRLP
ncbi:response regulator transcription factor [Planotetraspora phitsanulokensis]|uniref:DNA-binding response regulator n=2 Tax=Planotetraspora phitsanulokensis TaxID=575192 RepID=A0A8J3UDH3_9ACTN|nr:DNA-binding response regulator [Planotetraspora phitsanulokensis]